MLIQLVGDDLHALALEVDKLAVWADGEPIGEREVEALASPAAGEPTFALTDAWGAHNTGRALAASETILERERSPAATRRADSRRRSEGTWAGCGRSSDSRRRACPRRCGKAQHEPVLRRRSSTPRRRASRTDELHDASVRLSELYGALKGGSKLAPDLEVQRALVDLTRRWGSTRHAVGARLRLAPSRERFGAALGGRVARRRASPPATSCGPRCSRAARRGLAARSIVARASGARSRPAPRRPRATAASRRFVSVLIVER